MWYASSWKVVRYVLVRLCSGTLRPTFIWNTSRDGASFRRREFHSLMLDEKNEGVVTVHSGKRLKKPASMASCLCASLVEAARAVGTGGPFL